MCACTLNVKINLKVQKRPLKAFVFQALIFISLALNLHYWSSKFNFLVFVIMCSGSKTSLGCWKFRIACSQGLRVPVVEVEGLTYLALFGSLRPTFQFTFHIVHFILDQIDGECLDRCGLSGFDVDNF